MTSYAPKTGDIDPAYSLTARVLHWITAALVLTMIPLGIIGANNWGGSWQDQIYNLHRSIGTLLIVIIIARLGYRLTHKPLPLPPDVPAAQRHAAHAVHWALYGLLLAQPFIGWAATSAYRAPIIVFGLFQLPPIIGENRAVVGAAVHGACRHGHCHHGPCGRAYRRCPLSSLCAPGRRSAAHG